MNWSRNILRWAGTFQFRKQASQGLPTVHLEKWLVRAEALAFTAFLLLIVKGKFHFDWIDPVNPSNSLSLFSTISETLGAILALVITATLVATQLAAQYFTPRVVRFRMRDPWMWGAIAMYLIAILFSLESMAAIEMGRTHPISMRLSSDLTLLITYTSLFYLLPFTLAILRSFETESFIDELLRRKAYDGIGDLFRKAVNEGLVRQIEIATSKLENHAAVMLDGCKAQPSLQTDQAKSFARLGVNLGRYAATKKDPEAIQVAMQYLTDMTVMCTERIYRGSAERFNEAVIELKSIADEEFGE
jgi:hypothetical protein